MCQVTGVRLQESTNDFLTANFSHFVTLHYARIFELLKELLHSTNGDLPSDFLGELKKFELLKAFYTCQKETKRRALSNEGNQLAIQTFWNNFQETRYHFRNDLASLLKNFIDISKGNIPYEVIEGFIEEGYRFTIQDLLSLRNSSFAVHRRIVKMIKNRFPEGLDEPLILSDMFLYVFFSDHSFQLNSENLLATIRSTSIEIFNRIFVGSIPVNREICEAVVKTGKTEMFLYFRHCHSDQDWQDIIHQIEGDLIRKCNLDFLALLTKLGLFNDWDKGLLHLIEMKEYARLTHVLSGLSEKEYINSTIKEFRCIPITEKFFSSPSKTVFSDRSDSFKFLMINELINGGLTLNQSVKVYERFIRISHSLENLMMVLQDLHL